jgi:hypothetical protein
MNLSPSLRNRLRTLVTHILSIFLRESCYYSKFYGSHKSPMLKTIGNIAHVKRYARELSIDSRGDLARFFFRYNRIRPLILTEEESRLAAEMGGNGIAFLPPRPLMADHFLSYFDWFFDDPVPSDEYKRASGFNIDNRVLAYMVDTEILRVHATYMKAMPYVRACIGLNVTFPLRGDRTSRDKVQAKMTSGFADDWHRDTPGLVQAHMLLQDTAIDDPHMLYAAGSHQETFHKLSDAFSEEYVNENFQVIHCIGKKGTIYLFDGSRGLHRMFSSKGRIRMTADILFTPGNNMLTEECPIKNITDLDLGGLDNFQREALKYFK